MCRAARGNAQLAVEPLPPANSAFQSGEARRFLSEAKGAPGTRPRARIAPRRSAVRIRLAPLSGDPVESESTSTYPFLSENWLVPEQLPAVFEVPLTLKVPLNEVLLVNLPLSS
jgi:hypothetical protein